MGHLKHDQETIGWRKEVALRLRYLERVPLGTPYPDIVERVKRTTRAPELDGRCHVAVDATGVGRPAVDLPRRAGLGATILPEIFTGGAAESLSKGYYGVPKRDLVTGLQVLLQRGGLQMATMRVKVSCEGREQCGAWWEGTHHDLVFAVALACWAARQREGVPAGDGGADRQAGVEQFGMATVTTKEFRMRIGEKALPYQAA